MALLTLPEALLTHIMMRFHCFDIRSFDRAAQVCTQLHNATETACELHTREKGGPVYVPVERYFKVRSRLIRFTWRTRLCFSFRQDIYKQSFKLYALDAGLLVYGEPCYQNPSANRESKVIAHALNRWSNDDDDSEGEDVEENSCSEDEVAKPYTTETGYHSLATVLHDGSKLVEVHELTEDATALAVDMSSWALKRSLKQVDELMNVIVEAQILISPWYIPTEVWMALRIVSRPALPVEGPIVVVKTTMRGGNHWALKQPQTVIELRDGATRTTVLGRAKLGYCTQPLDDTGGPTVWRFSVFDPARTDSTLAQGAVCADGEKGHDTSKALADAAAAFSPSEANLLAARVMLWRGIEEFCNSHIDPTMTYHWPLRVSPDLIGKHGSFLAWRGLKLKPLSAPHANMMAILGGGGAWPYMILGAEDEFSSCACGLDPWDESDGDDSDEEEELTIQSLLSDRRQEKMSKIEARKAERDALAERSRIEAAKRLLTRSFDPDREDSDSEYEPDDEYCDKCGGRLTWDYASGDADDVCECLTDDDEEEEEEEVEEGED